MVLLSSCGTDETETPAPSITIVNASNIVTEVSPSAEVSYPLEISALEKIEKITIMEYIGSSGKDVTGYPKTTGFKSSTEDNFTYKYKVNETEGTIKLVFSVTDKRGKTSSKEHTLTIKPVVVSTPMEYTTAGGIIANKMGPDDSAWDLALNVRRKGIDTDKDMQNPTSSTVWIKGWDGVRNTTFVKANSFAFETATVEAATEAFKAGTALAQVTNVAVNDIYIAKIKGGNNYAVIIITYADDDIALNAEKIEFSYKKLAETSGQ